MVLNADRCSQTTSVIIENVPQEQSDLLWELPGLSSNLVHPKLFIIKERLTVYGR